MPKLVGAMKLKNEELFIEKVVGQVLTYVDALVIVDDWSEDRTAEIIQDLCSASKIPLRIEKSPHKTYHEFSDGNLELQMVHGFEADWCIQIDADDVYEYEFVKRLDAFMARTDIDTYYAGATHMWTTDSNKNWWEVEDFRIDSGWVNFWKMDNVGIQHQRPALFRIIPGQLECGYGRDHGYLCPKQIFKSVRKFDPQLSFCHFGYATPKLAEKKCERHGSIPPLTAEETQNEIIYPPDYMPEGFTPEINIATFKKAWTNTEGVQLRKFPRRIWS